MRLYHGSSVNNLKLLTNDFSDQDNFEGKGIYLTDSIQVAKDYARSEKTLGSVYEVELTGLILDFTTKEKIDNFLSQTLDQLSINWNNLSWTDAATTHILNHHGKNGIWSLAQDVSDIFKFEKDYKNRPDLNQIQASVIKAVNNAIGLYSAYKINDRDNHCSMYIVKDQSLPIINEITIKD